MTVTVGINGFGRIGRSTLAHIAESARNDVQVVKINATGPVETNAHLLRYDSVHGRFKGEVQAKKEGDKDFLVVNGQSIAVFHEKDPASIPWGAAGVGVQCLVSLGVSCTLCVATTTPLVEVDEYNKSSVYGSLCSSVLR